MDFARIAANQKLRYMVMLTIHYFALGMSGIFINVFLWKIHNSLTILAVYSLVLAVSIVASFPLCAAYARVRTPLASLRAGIVVLAAGYAAVLAFREDTVNHIVEIGILIGTGTSLFVVGQHMQTLDSTKDDDRDNFLFLGNFCVAASGMIAPALAGFLISRFPDMTGYYLVLGLSIAVFGLAILVSLGVKGKKVTRESHFRTVWKSPSREWRVMFWLSMFMAMIEGTYGSFLVNIMTFSVIGNELGLGFYGTFTAVVFLVSSLSLTRISRPERRIPLFACGTLLVAASSILMSARPGLPSLMAFGLCSTVGLNLIFTIFDSWTYASIEADPRWEQHRLDYIVIREIPLGVGRMLGIGMFLALQLVFTSHTLPVTFAIYGCLFMALIPLLVRLWGKRPAAPEQPG